MSLARASRVLALLVSLICTVILQQAAANEAEMITRKLAPETRIHLEESLVRFVQKDVPEFKQCGVGTAFPGSKIRNSTLGLTNARVLSATNAINLVAKITSADVDRKGNIFVVGKFTGKSLPLDYDVQISKNDRDRETSFAASFDYRFKPLWYTTMAGVELTEIVSKLEHRSDDCIVAASEVLIAGFFVDRFSRYHRGSQEDIAEPGRNAFVTKFLPTTEKSGEYSWTFLAGGTKMTRIEISSMDVSTAGVFLCANYQGSKANLKIIKSNVQTGPTAYIEHIVDEAPRFFSAILNIDGTSIESLTYDTEGNTPFYKQRCLSVSDSDGTVVAMLADESAYTTLMLTYSGYLKYIISMTSKSKDLSLSGLTDKHGDAFTTENDNLIISGVFEEEMRITLNDTDLVVANLTSSNTLRQAAFIAKFDAETGQYLKSTVLESTSSIRNIHITADTVDNIYIVGTFTGKLILPGSSVQTGEDDDGFIIVYDSELNYITHKIIHGEKSESFTDIEVSLDTDILLVAGYTDSDALVLEKGEKFDRAKDGVASSERRAFLATYKLNCTCNTRECIIPFCNGVRITDPNVCSSRGSCGDDGICKCSSGFGGSQCMEVLCYGIEASSSAACYGNGKCVASNTCACKETHTGNQCEITRMSCFSKNGPEACGGALKGVCIDQDVCRCLPGYTGRECQDLIELGCPLGTIKNGKPSTALTDVEFRKDTIIEYTPYASKVDSEGNIYVAGLDMNYDLDSEIEEDSIVRVFKLSPTGEELCSSKVQSPNIIYVTSMLLTNDSVYIVGYFTATNITFYAGDIPRVFGGYATDSKTMYVARFSLSCQFQQYHSVLPAKSSFDAVPRSLVVMGTSLYVVGNYQRELHLSEQTHVSSTKTDTGFLMQIDLDTNQIVRVKSIEATHTLQVMRVNLFRNSLVLAGHFSGKLEVGNFTKYSVGETDAFLIRFLPNEIGIPDICVAFGGAEQETVSDLAIDSAGNIFLMITTKSDLIAPENHPQIITFSIVKSAGILVKFTSGGYFEFARNLKTGGFSDSSARAVTVDHFGNVFATINLQESRILSFYSSLITRLKNDGTFVQEYLLLQLLVSSLEVSHSTTSSKIYAFCSLQNSTSEPTVNPYPSFENMPKVKRARLADGTFPEYQFKLLQFSSQECIKCPVAYYSDIINAEKCKLCSEVGGTSEVEGTVICTRCDQGIVTQNKCFPVYAIVLIIVAGFLLIFIVIITGVMIRMVVRKKLQSIKRTKILTSTNADISLQLLNSNSGYSHLDATNNSGVSYGLASASDEPSFLLSDKLFEIKFEELKDLVPLLSGVTGSGALICKARWHGETVVVKLFQSNMFGNESSLDEFKHELQLLASTRHGNVVNFYGVCIKRPKIGLVLEFCSKGSLASVIKSGEVLSWERKLLVLQDVVKGMNHLHKKKIIHRDLKSDNVLIDSKFNAKITDFGISKLKEENNNNAKFTRAVGTSIYMAPEVTLGQPYDERCDIFSFAIIMYELLFETNKPYAGKETFNIEVKVATDPTFRPDVPDRQYSESEQRYITLMKKCWVHNYKERPTFEQVQQEVEELLDSTSA